MEYTKENIFTKRQLDDEVEMILEQHKILRSNNQVVGQYTFRLLGRKISLSLSDDLQAWQIQINDFINKNFEKKWKNGVEYFVKKVINSSFNEFYVNLFNLINKHRNNLEVAQLSHDRKRVKTYWRKSFSIYHWITTFQEKFFSASFKPNRIQVEKTKEFYWVFLARDDERYLLNKKPIEADRMHEIVYTLVVFGIIDIFSFIGAFDPNKPVNSLSITAPIQVAEPSNFRSIALSNVEQVINDFISVIRNELTKNLLNVIYYFFVTLTNSLIQELYINKANTKEFKTIDMAISTKFAINYEEINIEFFADVFQLKDDTFYVDKGDFYLNYILYSFRKVLNNESQMIFQDYRLNRLTSARLLAEFGKSKNAFQKLVRETIIYKIIINWHRLNKEVKDYVKMLPRFNKKLYAFLEKLSQEDLSWDSFNDKIERTESPYQFRLGLYTINIVTSIQGNIEISTNEFNYARDHIDEHNFIILSNFTGLNILPTELDYITETDSNEFIVQLLTIFPDFQYGIILTKDMTIHNGVLHLAM